VHIEAENSLLEVWKTLTYLFDKYDDAFSYYLEKKIHELDPKYFERISSFLPELKTCWAHACFEEKTSFGEEIPNFGNAQVAGKETFGR
jgi:hypothetical protein